MTGERQPTFIHPTNLLYEPLQYPLFFPHESPGWHYDLLTLSPLHLEHKVSQIEYYRQRIFTDGRFGMLGRLLNEYLVDMFSSVEDNRLSYIRHNQRLAVRSEIEETKGVSVLGVCTCQLPSWGLRGCSGRWWQTGLPSCAATGSRRTSLPSLATLTGQKSRTILAWTAKMQVTGPTSPAGCSGCG